MFKTPFVLPTLAALILPIPVYSERGERVTVLSNGGGEEERGSGSNKEEGRGTASKVNEVICRQFGQRALPPPDGGGGGMRAPSSGRRSVTYLISAATVLTRNRSSAPHLTPLLRPDFHSIGSANHDS